MRNKLFVVVSLIVIASMVLAACTTATPEKVVEKVIETVVVTEVVEGETVEKVVTATPEPEAPPAEFKSADTTTWNEVTFADPETLDPALDYESGGIGIIMNIYDTLIFYNKEDPNSFVPQLATEVPSVENGGISADGLTYMFNVRTGVKFHDGTDMTVEDAAYSLQRGLLQGGTFSPQWLFTEAFFGVGKYDITDVITDTALTAVGVETLNDDPENLIKVDAAELQRVCEVVTSAIVADPAANTLTLKLAQPWAPLIPTLAGSWGSVYSKAWAVSKGAWDGDCATWQNFYGKSSEQVNEMGIGTSEMGTGPYMLDHWTPEEEIVLKANESYWRTEPAWEGGPTGAPALKTIIIKNVAEFSTRYAMLQAGDADHIDAGSQADWPQLDELTGGICEQTDASCTPTENPDGQLELIRGFETSSRGDFFFTFVVNTDGGNNFIGSGQLDGNGVPPDFFSDNHIRKAFAYCFNYDIYLSDVLLGEGARSHGVMLPGMIGYDENAPVYEYDPAKCEEEFGLADVDKDGVPSAEDDNDVTTVGFRLTIAYNTGNTARQTMAEIFQNELSALNELYVVEATGLPWPTYLRNQRASKLPLFPVGWIEDIHETHNWVQPYAVGTYGARQALPDELMASFSEVIDRAVVETDPDTRHQIYQEFNQLYHEAATGLILFVAQGRRYQQRWVEGWFNNPIYAGDYFYTLSKQ
jgi:peptide/nickel transport system substrate-binding protein